VLHRHERDPEIALGRLLPPGGEFLGQHPTLLGGGRVFDAVFVFFDFLGDGSDVNGEVRQRRADGVVHRRRLPDAAVLAAVFALPAADIVK
jgi:hypothetical protein